MNVHLWLSTNSRKIIVFSIFPVNLTVYFHNSGHMRVIYYSLSNQPINFDEKIIHFCPVSILKTLISAPRTILNRSDGLSSDFDRRKSLATYYSYLVGTSKTFKRYTRYGKSDRRRVPITQNNRHWPKTNFKTVILISRFMVSNKNSSTSYSQEDLLKTYHPEDDWKKVSKTWRIFTIFHDL